MDIRLHYTEQGTGFPLILLHGNGESGDCFSSQITYFSNMYRVIAPDTRGHGKTPRGTAPFTIQQFARDLYTLTEQLGIRRTLLLGFSDGANIAMRFTLMYPEKVSGLVLNGGNLNSGGIKRRVQFPIELGYRFTKRFAGKSEEAKKHMELLGLMVNEPDISPAELGEIKCPTLVIAGTRDMVKQRHTESIAGSLANAELAILGGDHFLAYKKPVRFNETVACFLNQIKEV